MNILVFRNYKKKKKERKCSLSHRGVSSPSMQVQGYLSRVLLLKGEAQRLLPKHFQHTNSQTQESKRDVGERSRREKKNCNCPTHSVERSKALSLPLLLFHFYSFSLLLPFYIFVVCLTSLWSVISILSILLIILVLCSRKQNQSRFYTADKVLWIACYCVKCSVNIYPKIQFSKLLCRLFTWTHR